VYFFQYETVVESRNTTQKGSTK